MQAWLDRKDELIKHAIEIRKSLGNLDPSQIKRKVPLEELINCYIGFINAHVNNFVENFGNGTYSTTPKYPEDHVMRVTLDQAAYDLQVIERIVFQRSNGAKGIDTLTLADYLASQALEIARPLLVSEPNDQFKRHFPVVFTYFQKSPSIRLIPYTNVALISIPYTAAAVLKDLLAIPHEVGHYVFWHGKDIRKTPFMAPFMAPAIRAYIDDIYNGIYKLDKELVLKSGFFNWLEEIFADVYGSLVAGALIAVDFQDLQLENSKYDFESDDGEHPLPILRPYIYAEATRHFNNAHGNLLKTVLKKRWNNNLPKWVLPGHLFKLAINPEKYLSDAKPTPDEMKRVGRWLERMASDKKEFDTGILEADATTIIDKIFKDQMQALLTSLPSLRTPSEVNFWENFVDDIDINIVSTLSAPNSEESQLALLDGLYDKFSAACNDDVQKDAEGYLNSDHQIHCQNHNDLINMWQDKWHFLTPDWLPVFKADGWTVKGPTKPWST